MRRHAGRSHRWSTSMTVRHLLSACAILACLAAPARATDLRLLTHPLAPFTVGTSANLSGLAVEVARGILKRTGDGSAIATEPFTRVLQDIQAGPSTIGFIVARTPAREPTMQWVGPIVSTGVYLYKKAGSPVSITTLEDARKLAHIGVARGNADEKFLTEQGFKNLDLSDNQQLDLKKLQLGRLDATPISEIVFSTMVHEAGLQASDFERTPVKFYDSTVYFGVSPDVPKSTVQAWQDALDAMKASGEYAAIVARYTE
jgi:polar amino acid transport system substrate-binding protein